MFECLKKTKPVKVDTKEDLPEVTLKKVFTFIVGHNERAQGATNYLGETEFSFNSRIAKKCMEKLKIRKIGSVIIYRPAVKSYSQQVRSVIEQVKKYNTPYGMCLHFNDAESKQAHGCEVLIVETETKRDEKIADYITDQLNERLGFRERGDDGVKEIQAGHGGYGMLNALHEQCCTSVLVEPVFANHRASAKKIFENEDEYVNILVDAIEMIMEW